MPLYKEYIAQMREQYAIKSKKSFDNVAMRRYNSVVEKMENNPRFNPQKTYNKYLAAVNNNIQLQKEINDRVAQLRQQKINAIDNARLKELSPKIMQWRKDRNDALNAMNAKAEALGQKIQMSLKTFGMEGTISVDGMITNFSEVYKDHSNYPNRALYDLPTVSKLINDPENPKKNMAYLSIIENNFESYKEYVALKATYEEKKSVYEVDHAEERKFYNENSKKLKEYKNMTYKDFADETLTSETLKDAPKAKNNTLSLKDAVDYMEKETEINRNAYAETYHDCETYLEIENATNARISKNQETMFNDLASAQLEKNTLNGWQIFWGNILPASIYGPSSIINKVDALTDILKEGGFSKEEINRSVADIIDPSNGRINIDAIETDDMDFNENDELDRQQLTVEENKNLGDITAIENKDMKKSDIVENKEQTVEKGLSSNNN